MGRYVCGVKCPHGPPSSFDGLRMRVECGLAPSPKEIDSAETSPHGEEAHRAVSKHEGG